ncbi:PREDICTED: uncharacterized protein LOC109150786 [Ipomoea nil]|uniref:uncharacterized protein LOC109150786 n=1 Tax=Ipomoea nil TaxID=35883 RepID=UPI0009017F5D|nr:PREDICTED: uncharacterized protein LOC109150786 [Ipomoea nil]
MAKAYGRMEWAFLEGMMLRLGFFREWVKLMMLCVTTVRYTIMVNEQAGGVVVPTRGLWQGDPLSPYLFIICVDGLSLLLQNSQQHGLIHGCRVARGAPAISHMFFAYDILLFFKANEHEGGKISRCLIVYEGLSGQAINYHKSSITFSHNTAGG